MDAPASAAPNVRRAALAFIFVTAVLDIVAMGIVIPFPTQQVMDDELAIQLWELVMAGEIGTPEYRRLDAEISRRKALAEKHGLTWFQPTAAVIAQFTPKKQGKK